jgi:malate synthase
MVDVACGIVHTVPMSNHKNDQQNTEMKAAATKRSQTPEGANLANRIVPVNRAPEGFDPKRDLPAGFVEFLRPLHKALTARQQSLVERREVALAESNAGRLPEYLPASEATRSAWRIELPQWCADQRNQMTGPADEADLVVKMLNSGAPGVMLDLEDSTANVWEHNQRGTKNILEALAGRLNYFDRKRDKTIEIRESNTVIFTRPRGLHLHQAGVLEGKLLPASLFDVAMVAFQVDDSTLKHPLCFYIPKSESAEEALWWRDLFQMIAKAKGLPANAIKCMALVESHPMAFQMEEFAWNLRDHILGLNLGRWDYMATQRRIFSKPAATDSGDLPQARDAGDWRDDGALSQPRRRRVEYAGAKSSCGR